MQVLELDNNAYGSREAEASDDEVMSHMNTKHYLKTMGISLSCRKGNCREGSNQDNYFCYVDSISKIFIIADGHGKISTTRHVFSIFFPCRSFWRYGLIFLCNEHGEVNRGKLTLSYRYRSSLGFRFSRLP